MSSDSPVLLVCGSVISSLDATYLSQLRSTLIHDPYLAELKQQIVELGDVWSLLVTKNPSFKKVNAAPSLHALAEWIIDGNPSSLLSEKRTSRNTQAAILTVLAHILEYAGYLTSRYGPQKSESILTETLELLKNGGVQGLCIGLLSAIAISCSKTKFDLAKHAAVALRLALCAGAIVDLDEVDSEQPTVCLSARWSRNEGDYEGFEAVINRFPEAYVSVRMDSASATITTHEGVASQLMGYLEDRGALVKRIDIPGRFHHRRHEDAFRNLVDLCASLLMFQFPKEASPLAPLRRNDTGELVTVESPLHEIALECILVKKADWHSVMRGSVESLSHNTISGSKSRVLVLGPVDCIPRSLSAISPLQTVRPATANELRRYPDDSIAVIGASACFPGSESLEKFWDMIMAKRTSQPLNGAGDFDHTFFRKSAREAEYMDPQHRLALHLAHEALESGGFFSPSSSSTDNVGCYLGISSCDYQEHVDTRSPTAFSFTGTARAFSSGRISHFFGLTGPSMTIDTACSSSGVAIHTACKAVQTGECSMALAGGVNLMTPEARSHQNLGAASFLSPSTQCRPFDSAADGYRRGEGGGVVLLKRLSEAVADNDSILGVIAASAVNNSKGNRSITLPSSESQTGLYRRVLKTAGVQPDQVSYVEAHGTGTQKGDPIEYQSIQNVFDTSSSSSPLSFGSIKANIGHSGAASGVASLLKVLLMLQHNVIPPQANFTALNPAIIPRRETRMRITQEAEAWEAPFKAALVNNYGASGANAAMVLCQPPATYLQSAVSAAQSRQYPILISAHSKSSLREYCRSLLSLVDAKRELGEALLPTIAFHLAQSQNQSLAHRVIFYARSIDEFKQRLSLELQKNDIKTQKSQPEPKPVVLVFSGQTGRRPQLDYEVYSSSKLLRSYLDQCDRAMQSLGLNSIFPTIFETKPIDDLADLHCLQFAIQFSTAKAWIDSGLDIKTLVGHSLGQLTALCVSSAVHVRDALKLISGRALLIQKHWGSQKGCMLSVDADATSVHDIISSLPEGHTVEVACYNSATNLIVVGAEAAIDIFEKVTDSKKISTKKLPISHGFHSEMLDCIMDQYYNLLQGISISRPTIPIEACSKDSGSWTNVTPALIARQSREPVYFDQAISRIEQRLGPCVWIEAGASSAGITLARRALMSHPLSDSHSFYATRLQNSDSLGSLTDTTIGIWNEGILVQHWLYHFSERHAISPLQLPSYQFEKSHHWLPYIPKSQDSESVGGDQQRTTQEPLELVSLIGQVGSNKSVVEFSINQQSGDYLRFVKGRTVFEQYLTPSSVYVESAARALRLLQSNGSSSNKLDSLCFEVEEIGIHAPFGLDLQKQLLLRMEQQTQSTWGFAITSHSFQDPNKAGKLQASGIIKLQRQDSILGSQRPLLRSIQNQCYELRDDRDASIIQSAFAKKILGRVADYDDAYFGIRSVTFKGLTGVGEVALPEISSRNSETSIFSPPVFDNLLLVAELHASSIGELSADELYICNGYDTITLQTPEKSLESSRGPWLVLSNLDHKNNKTIVSDIIVFNASDKSCVLSILGASFTRISTNALKKTLVTLNGGQPNKALLSEEENSTSAQEFPTAVFDASRKIPSFEIHQPNTKIAFSNIPIGRTPVQESGFGRYDVPSLSGLPSMVNSGYVSGSSSKSSSPPAIPDTATSEPQGALLSLLADHLDCSQGISPETPLGEIGLDSLVSIQLQSDIEKAFGKSLDVMTVNENTTFSELCGMVLQQGLIAKPASGALRDTSNDTVPIMGVSGNAHLDSQNDTPNTQMAGLSQNSTDFITCATKEFASVKENTSLLLKKSRFEGFFTGTYQKQSSLVLAYILEAFDTLGCDLRELKAGEPLATIPFMPKHENLVWRLHQILEEAGLISGANGRWIRTSKPILSTDSAEKLSRDILVEYPEYQPDHKPLGITGPRLADCLSGKADPLQLLFQGKGAFKLLEDVYVSSPMFATGNKMLSEFIHRISTQLRRSGSHLRILEIGAGTGGTTRLVLDQLLRCDVNFAYTFTDISSALVTGSKKKFTAQYGPDVNMEFSVLNIEKPPPSSMVHSYDLIISSNCIHATQDLGLSCTNMEKLLKKEGGMLCLLELTRPLGWLDCVFGLLDGWWRFNDGRSYALANENHWKSTLMNAGFKNIDWTDNGSPESAQFRLITAQCYN